MMRPRSLLMPSLLGAVALLLVVLTCLLWQRMCSIDQIPRRTAESGKEASTSAQRPKDDVEFVEFPGIGQVKGKAVHRTLSATEEEDGALSMNTTPEKLLLDSNGNFLYLRNRVPVFKSKRRLDLVEKFYRTKFAEHLRGSSGDEPQYGVESFRIVGPTSVDMSPSVIRRQIIRNVENVNADVEVWAVKVFSPWDGEKDAFLTSINGGTIYNRDHGRAHTIMWDQATLRKWSLEYLEGVSGHSLGTVEIAEEWEEVPSEATDGKKEDVWFRIFEGERLNDDATYEERKRAFEAEKQGK